MNESFQMGMFPQQLKCATIYPNLKGEDKEIIIKYRPFSILPFLSKLFEKKYTKTTEMFSH